MEAATDSARKRYPGQNIAAAQDPDALLTVETVATLVGNAPGTIRHWERKGLFPPAERRGRAVRWRARVIRQFLAGEWKPAMPPA